MSGNTAVVVLALLAVFGEIFVGGILLAFPGVWIGRGLLGAGLLGMAGALWWWAYGPPDTAFWLRMEDRFARIDGEIEGIWTVDAKTLRVAWEVRPAVRSTDPDGNRERRLDRFRLQAMLAGRALQRVRSMRGTYAVNPDAPSEDHWLCALGAWLDRANSTKGDHVVDRPGAAANSESRTFERMVDASEHFCAHLASLGRS